MKTITLGQIYNTLTFLTGFVALIATTFFGIQKGMNKMLEPIYAKITDLDLNQCKNFLTQFIADVKRGEQMGDIEIKRAYDVYEHYKDDLNANSYIHTDWEKLKKEGKI